MTKSQHPAGRITRALADLRAWIAIMFATFGLMLAVYGAFFVTAEDLAKGGGLNLTLWTGIGMLGFAAMFALWFWMRPEQMENASVDEDELAAHELGE